MTQKFSPAVRQGRAANAGYASAAITLDTSADLFDDDLDYVAEAFSQARHTQNTIILPESPTRSRPATARLRTAAANSLTDARHRPGRADTVRLPGNVQPQRPTAYRSTAMQARP